eukprot:TRINITY_DN22948_c0_g2_i1.p1 TRINITY_DN22948_c0_g2~~TRINITY_DN22948_c0_g2_i1.p1  ORF type:complete len:317 (+),score=89.97 TRINITY_DN22948_c0_g2_i1:174-1124(+)
MAGGRGNGNGSGSDAKWRQYGGSKSGYASYGSYGSYGGYGSYGSYGGYGGYGGHGGASGSNAHAYGGMSYGGKAARKGSYAGNGGGSWGSQGNGRYGASAGTAESPKQPASKNGENMMDLLVQVAPQARISGNASQIASKTSANIMSKLFTESESAGAGRGDTNDGGAGGKGVGDESAANSALAGSNKQSQKHNKIGMKAGEGGAPATNLANLWSVSAPKTSGEDEIMVAKEADSDQAATSDGRDGNEAPERHRRREQQEQVVWKSSSERSGHRQRYRERRNARKEAETFGKEDKHGANFVPDPDGVFRIDPMACQ